MTSDLSRTPHSEQRSPSMSLAESTAISTRSRRALLKQAALAGAVLPVAPVLPPFFVPARTAMADAAKATAPDAGTDRQTRGAGHPLQILLKRAPNGAAPHSAQSSVDYLAATPVFEPLMHMLPDGTLIPTLIEEVPSIENGMLAKDYRSATFTFLKALTWSDGEPVTSADLVFTWQWVTNAGNGSSNFAMWGAMSAVKATDERTAEVTFAQPTADWYAPFTGNATGCLYPAHAFNNDPTNRNDAFLTAPIGTGPYVMKEFAQSGAITYEANDAYRDPNKPYFSGITMSVGDDASASATAVLSGKSDFAWDLDLDAATIGDLLATDGTGSLGTVPTGSVEALRFNFSDPARKVHGEVSQKDTPHPIFSDPEVRRALNTAVNRGQIAATIYGQGVHTTANVLVGLASYTSTLTSWAYDLDQANQILDAAGWTRDGEQRSKDGVKLAFEIVAPSGATRKQILALLHDDFAQIGAKVTVTQIDPQQFFNVDPAADQSFYHMPWDAGLWADGTFSAFPLSYMRRWYSGKDGDNIAQQSNAWLGEHEAYDGVIADTQRYANADYDALFESLESTFAAQDADDLLIQMNDFLVKEVVEIPIVALVDRYAVSDRVRAENLALGPFAVPLWNIANWNEPDTAG